MLRVLLLIMAVVAAVPAMAGDAAHFNALYEGLYARYWRPSVTIHGIETTVFDYAAMQRDGGRRMQAIADALALVNPDSFGNDDEAKAFWINVYNFTAMRMVIDAYPVDSITSFKISLIKHPWSRKAINVGGRRYSLGEIEKDILLSRYNDPRIIFAVSCAAVSCPDRTSAIFAGAGLDTQLNELLRTFFHNPGKGLYLNRETKTLTLAWILKKDSHLFQDDETQVLAFVLPYLDKDQQSWLAAHQVRIDYFEHDWTLNDLARADTVK